MNKTTIGPVSIIYKIESDRSGPQTINELWHWIDLNFAAHEGWEFIRTSSDEIEHVLSAHA